jgi:putative membrane protein
MRASVPIVAGAAAAAVFALPGAWAAETLAEPYSCGPYMMWGGGWYSMFFGPLLMVLVLAAVLAAAALLVRRFGGPWQATAPRNYPPPGRMPIEILKERFARGEIDKDEFDERRRLLAG